MLVTEKMRDKIKNIEYFNERIRIKYELLETSMNEIRLGQIKQERINIVKRAIVFDYLFIINCKYSCGYQIESLKDDLLNAIILMDESWDGFWKGKAGKPWGSIILNQYNLDGVDQVLWILSLGYLLNIDSNYFKKVIGVIDRDQVKDFLFEYIIRAKIKDREEIKNESFEMYFSVPNTFGKLRLAITQTDKAAAEVLVKEFITKDWYKNHKGTGWYNNHKSLHNTYFGYWSFETAAVVKIMGLDDSSFINCKYYPADLVHYNQG